MQDMMQTLLETYDSIPPHILETLIPNHKKRKIAFVADLDDEGHLIEYHDMRGEQPAFELAVGSPISRSGRSPKPMFMTDNPDFFFSEKYFEGVKNLNHTKPGSMRDLLTEMSESNQPDIAQVGHRIITFLDSNPEPPQDWALVDNKGSVTKEFLAFRMVEPDGTKWFPSQKSSFQDWWVSRLSQSDVRGECTLTGEIQPFKRLQGKGLLNKPLYSLNQNCAQSFGQGKDYYPLGMDTERKYVMALKYLDRKDQPYRLSYKDDYWYAWGLNADKSLTSLQDLINPMGKVQDYQAAFEAMFKGNFFPTKEGKVNLMCVSTHGDRLFIKQWLSAPYSEVFSHIQTWKEGLEIVAFGKFQSLLPIRTVVLEGMLTYIKNGFKVARNEAHEKALYLACLDSCFMGKPLPQEIVPYILNKVERHGGYLPDADFDHKKQHRVQIAHAQILKLAMNLKGEAMTAALNKEDTNPYYILGRVLSQVNYIQYKSIGSVNLPKGNVLLGSARKNPAHVISELSAVATSYASKVYHGLVEDFLALMTHIKPEYFQTRLTDDQYMRVVLGFFHQEHQRRHEISEHKKDQQKS